MSELNLLKVDSKRDFKRFLNFPYILYKGVENWVPPLKMDQKNILNRDSHPFYEKAEMELFLVEDDRGNVLGRIAAIHNHVHQEYYGDDTGYFGFYECVKDKNVSDMLISAAEDWLKKRGLKRCLAPMNPSTNYVCGLLIEGFQYPPSFMMPYNMDYYQEFIESKGYKKGRDLLSFLATKESVKLERMRRLSDAIMKKENITVRKIDMKNLKREIELAFQIYNDAWSKNWGFVPMSDVEIERLAKEVKPVCDPDIILFLEKDGEAIGFLFAMPDLNIIIKDLNGNLLPTGIFKLLFGRKKINKMRVIAMGLKQKFQNLGLPVVLYKEIIERGINKGYVAAEMSWVLEDNMRMVKAASGIGGVVDKKYRIYEKTL